MKIFDLANNGLERTECLPGFGFVPAARTSANVINFAAPGCKARRIRKGSSRVRHTLNMDV